MLDVSVVLTMCLAMQDSPQNMIDISATLDAKSLVVGQEYEIQLTVSLAEGWSASAAGIPKPILEIDVPKSVQLSGKVLSEYRELSRNEFLQAPYERMIEVGSNVVQFTLTSEPNDGDRISLNIIAYLRHGEDENAFFVRKRLELPLKPGAAAQPGDSSNSNWGDDGSGLQIGEHAKPFALPRADGSTVTLDDYLGKTNIILTTYRAHW